MSHACLVFLAVLGPPGPTPFPYTTLFRSEATLEALTSTIVDVLDVDAALIRMPDERRDWLLPRALKVSEPRLDEAARPILFRPQPFGAHASQRLFRLAESFQLTKDQAPELEPFLRRG